MLAYKSRLDHLPQAIVTYSMSVASRWIQPRVYQSSSVRSFSLNWRKEISACKSRSTPMRLALKKGDKNNTHVSWLKRFMSSTSMSNKDVGIRFKHTQTTDLSSSNLYNTKSPLRTDTLLETWFYEVCQYGSMEANLPFKTIIKSLPPQDYPDMNKVVIQLHFDAESTEADIPTGKELSEICDLYALSVKFDADKANMKVSCDLTPGVPLPVVCIFQIPLQFDLNIRVTGGGDVSLEKMESSKIMIETEKGNCHLKSIKCGSLSAVCHSGNITSKGTLLGNIWLHCGRLGTICADKLQGSNISCETEMGFVNIESLYAENASFRSVAGRFRLGHCHGQLCVQGEHSDITVESLEGDLDASLQSGNLMAHLSKHNKVDVEIKTGNISLSFPEGSNTNLSLDSPAIAVDECLNMHFLDTSLPHHKEGFIGQTGKSQVNARTMSGTIELKQQDWIHSFIQSFTEKERDS